MDAPLLTLAIEASNPSAAGSGGGGPGVAVGLVQAGKPGVEMLGVESLRSRARHDDDLMPAIDRLWSRIGRPRADLALVAVSAGPGGYTGLRIAVVTAKSLCEVLGAACAAVPSAWVVARRARCATPFAVALASKGETTVVSVVESRDRCPSPPREMSARAVAALGVGAIVADRFLPNSIRERCAAAGIEVSEPVFDPVACLEIASLTAPTNPDRLAPIYGREPEAVRKWRELHGG